MMSSLSFLNSTTPTSDIPGESGEATILESDMTPPPQISSPSICSTSHASPLPSGAGVSLSLHEKLDILYSSPPSSPASSSSSSSLSVLPASAAPSGLLSKDTTGVVDDGVSDKMKHCKKGAVYGKSTADSDEAATVQVKGDVVSVQLPKNRSRDVRRYNVVLELPSSKSSNSCTGASVKRVDLLDVESDRVGYCSVCLVRPSNCVFLPCGHIKTCIKCGSNLYLRKMKCPVCRKVMKLRPHQVYV